MLVTAKQATNDIVRAIKAKLVVMLSGPPGIGKSDIVRAIAKQYNLYLIDIRLSQCDPTDLNGYPVVINGIATYIPMNIFPLETTAIPEGYAGFLVFLDEFNSASLAVQAASYKIVLDRRIGQHHLHNKAAVVCAGNMSNDNAIVNRLSTAMQSRLIHLELGVNPDEWREWATKNGIDHRIISYLHHRPDNLHNFDPNHNDKTFGCPRTWEFGSRLIKGINKLADSTALLAGTVGESIAREFVAYTDMYVDLPTIDEIIASPFTTKVNTEPSMLYAVSHMIAAHAKDSNIKTLMEYITRLPIEFETITLQSAIRKHPTMIREQCIKDWMVTKGMELFSD